jgi:NADH-quinone oxidoreductase subunit N
MNLGAFAVIIAVSRRTGTGDLSSWNGLFSYAPGLAIIMSVFLFSLGGIPPMVGFIAKFRLFQAVVGAGTASAYLLAVIMAANTVVSMAYYLGLVRRMWLEEAPDGDTTPIKVPVPIAAAMGLTALAVLALGIFPNPISELAKSATLAIVG